MTTDSDQLVSQLSFTSFTVAKTQDYTNLIAFYKSFGFKVVKTFTRDATTSGLDLNGVSNDSRKECWLNCYEAARTTNNGSIVPPRETIEAHHPEVNPKESNFNKGFMLKLRLVSHDVNKNIELPGEVIVFTVDTAAVKKIAIENKYELIEKTSDPKIEFYIKDPVGNVVGFTSFANGLTDKPIKSSKAFFTDKTAEDLENPRLKEPAKSNKKRIAVMTSGGDAPGMCAAVRAVVRAGIYLGCEVYGCYEGYSGLVKGGEYLKKMDWEDVRGWLSLGGTLIGTARCMEFKEKWGRLQAAKNMILRGVDALIVCGGDGSLTGADIFRDEWPSLVAELVKNGTFTDEQVEPYKHLTIVGLVGSIDNDMSSTDNTIGAYSSLERICEMVDYIDATAASHSRAFVVEVMGRHCGWLALMAGTACGADSIFIPERPPSSKSWKDELKEICLRHRSKGRRKTTVIVAEGALDDELNPITSEQVKECLVEIGLDTRITTLGHVQRGGTAVAFDRLLATLQGVDAVKAVLESTPDTPSPMIGFVDNKVVRRPLIESVKLTKSVATAINEKRFDDAMKLRDTTFKEAYDHFLSISKYDDGTQVLPENQHLNVAIIHVGAPTSALNAATRAAALMA
ncbi:unnamed protein product [Ambrosiozyma monospora]|uniref:Unnamed protein product n=1 Tax=Ambrosiozyma monospora TaxID=43982 RepID=A0ACB5T9I7_AMBMO|nr:unnamed protein product [Ambrosiozyma monospora]